MAEASLASSRSRRTVPPIEPTLPRYRVVRRWGPIDGSAELSIVIPAYDEALRLPTGIPLLREAVGDRDWEVVLVDDCSTDATAEVAAELLAGLPRARVLQLDRHRGKGAAVRAGVADAVGGRILFMDADMATDLRHLPEVVAHLDEHDVVIGSRFAPGAVATGLTPTRDTVSRLFLAMSRRVMGIPLTDFQCGFKAFRGPVAQVAFHLLEEDGWAFDVELLALADAMGASVHEVPVHWSSMPGSHMKISSDGPEMLRGLLRIRRRRGRAAALHVVELRATPVSRVLEELLAAAAPASVALPSGAGALVLLPFADDAVAKVVARRVSEGLPGSDPLVRLLSVEELLSPRRQREREAFLKPRR
ncbi:hypothetical protein BH10ACT1_BH10ACT1_08360 [soil metagenome]